ncbi:Transmembrane epididymal protein 1 [Manis javanica]|nr:Transmembrane epididymal protein 1 [Manis javanica]
MGGFEGHLYPGLSLFFYGLYQARLISRALICNYAVQYPPRHPWTKGRWARLRQIYCVGSVKIMSACILVAQELHNIRGQFYLSARDIIRETCYTTNSGSISLSICMTFFLSKCADAVSKNLLPQRCAAPEQGAQALGIFLFLLLMVCHMQDSEGVELQAHLLHMQTMLLLMLVVIAELWAPNMPQLWVMKALFYMIAGSWLIQTGSLLYKPISGHKWMDDDKHNTMFVTTFFCWHVASIAILMIWIHGSSFLFYCYIC